MNRVWLLGAGVALALAACGKPDPLAEARRACAQAEEAEAKIEACTTFIEMDGAEPGARSEALAERGAAHQEAGDVTNGLRDYAAALELNSDNMAAVKGRAGILIESGQLDAAQPLVERLLASGQFQGDAHFFDGAIALTRGDHAAALEAFDAAIAADPRYAPAFANRAAIKQAREDYSGALADYDRALEINPQLTPALSGRCWTRVLQEEGDMARARADADAAVGGDPRNVQAQLCRGLLQLRAGEWEAARASYDAALQVEPGNPTALFGRGVARRRAGDNDGREDMNQARDFAPHVARAFEDLGVQTY